MFFPFSSRCSSCALFPVDYAYHVSIKFTFLMYVNYLLWPLLLSSTVLLASAKFMLPWVLVPETVHYFLWSMTFVHLFARSWTGGYSLPHNSELSPLSHFL